MPNKLQVWMDSKNGGGGGLFILYVWDVECRDSEPDTNTQYERVDLDLCA